MKLNLDPFLKPPQISYKLTHLYIQVQKYTYQKDVLIGTYTILIVNIRQVPIILVKNNNCQK